MPTVVGNVVRAYRLVERPADLIRTKWTEIHGRASLGRGGRSDSDRSQSPRAGQEIPW